MSRPIPPSYQTENWPAYSEPLCRHVFETNGERVEA